MLRSLRSTAIGTALSRDISFARVRFMYGVPLMEMGEKASYFEWKKEKIAVKKKWRASVSRADESGMK